MPDNLESLYIQAAKKFSPDATLTGIDHRRPQSVRDLHFMMGVNGFFQSDNEWRFRPDSMKVLSSLYEGQKTSFYGPNATDFFYTKIDHGIQPDVFSQTFSRPAVLESIKRLRGFDDDLAARIAFLYGGLIRHFGSQFDHTDDTWRWVRNDIDFMATKMVLGGPYSSDALGAALAMYHISGGPLETSGRLSGALYYMSEAVTRDPIVPQEIKDLGLSQVARLGAYFDLKQGRLARPLPELPDYYEKFEGFPTVGAEFHMPLTALEKYSDLWQRLAVLNMSQYQPGSHIQFSRNDRDILEIRMSPSIYPVTVANWEYLKLVIPELRFTQFTTTVNRQRVGADFTWGQDRDLLNKLRALGLLSYASVYNRSPKKLAAGEIDFGGVYLGQTVRLDKGGYKFTGNWSGGEGSSGQFGVHAGGGANFPFLASHLSLGLADPRFFNSEYFNTNEWTKVKTLDDALRVPPDQISYIFEALEEYIQRSPTLGPIDQAAKRIYHELSPRVASQNA